MPTQAPDPRHTLADVIYAILIGSSLAAFGVTLLHMAGLVTGGVAGLALIGSYLTGLSVGTLFFAINLPFLILAQRTMGWPFAIKSAVAVALLSVLQGVADTLIIALAFVAVDFRHLLLSVLSAVALSLVLFAYHKKGRYSGY